MEHEFTICFDTTGAFRAWLLPHVLAALAPPAIYVIHRNRWQVSLRTVLAMLTTFAFFSWIVSDRLRNIATSPAAHIYAAQYLGSFAWTALLVLVISFAITLAAAYRLPCPGANS